METFAAEPHRRAAAQARRRGRRADGPRGHRRDLRAPEGGRTSLTRYRHLITDDNRKWWTLGGDVLRAVHDHARQHRRQRRPALDPARPATPRSPASSGRSTATRSPSPCCSRPAGGSATSSAAAACSSSASSSSPSPRRPPGFAAELDRPGDQPRRPGRRRGADDAGDALDRHRRLPAARARQGDGDLGRGLRPGARGRPGASAASSPSTSAGGRSSTSTSRSRSAPSPPRSSPCASRATRPSAARSTTPASPC